MYPNGGSETYMRNTSTKKKVYLFWDARCAGWVLGFDGEATRKMSAFLQGPKPELLHHQKFFENGTAERAKESGTEQNYNMIDGCVNNVPKKPRRIGGRWSVLDRLHIKQAERRQKDNAPQQEQERSRKS